MSPETELLNFIYQNAEMGVNTLEQLLDIIEPGELAKHLQAQLAQYKRMQREARQTLERLGCDEKGLGALEKLRTYLMINVQTLADKSPARIAEMLIIGSNMGVLDAKKKLARYTTAAPGVRALMQELGSIEEANVKRLEAFL